MAKVQGESPAAAEDATGTRDVMRVIGDLVSVLEPQLLEVWRSTGMTYSQRRVLRQLRDGPRSAGEVAASLGVSAPTLTRQLGKLEEHGYLTRAVDTTDRRKVLVDLTGEGRRVLAGHRVFAGSPIARAARDLTPLQQLALIESLGVLVSLARKTEVDAGA
ncbi:MAG TPA: MarR family transcriptional regulator [Candidatus Baltobacterales bacterium]|nr:MarR family transcriptional regulator [Candidatus Baltobacterales bacterium]